MINLIKQRSFVKRKNSGGGGGKAGGKASVAQRTAKLKEKNKKLASDSPF